MNETLKELKAVWLFLLMLAIFMIIADFIGLETGRGGNPQEGYQEIYYEY